jgi:tetratricopeptide (TPR) repeat protein
MRQGDTISAQKFLETAIELSPNAILRQETLADISEENHDWTAAEKSRKKVIRLGNNSVYESPEQHFQLLRTITKEMEYSGDPKSRIKDTSEALKRVKRKYKDDPTIGLQADIIEANVIAKTGDIAASKLKISSIQDRLNKTITKPAQLLLDMAKTYSSVGDNEKSQALLIKLAETYKDNEDVSDAIDRISDEPLSQKGKQIAINLNNTGKDLFAKKDYSKAVSLFSQALRHYPNNAGLNLNLMLALVRKMSAHGATKEQLNQCIAAKQKLNHIANDHPMYDRYKVLCEHLNKLSASAL